MTTAKIMTGMYVIPYMYQCQCDGTPSEDYKVTGPLPRQSTLDSKV